LTTCPIYKEARETQIQFIKPDCFGCVWHTTEKEYKTDHPTEEVNPEI
jgi:hypothetical protein